MTVQKMTEAQIAFLTVLVSNTDLPCANRIQDRARQK